MRYGLVGGHDRLFSMSEREWSTRMGANYFDDAAATWDGEPRRIALARAIGETIVCNAEPDRSMDVLDYGCGTGLLSLFLLPHVHSVTGADSSPGMLDVLRAKVAEASISGMRVIPLDLERDPAPAERFHMIVVSMTMHHVAQIEQLLRKFRQLLLPGGLICIADLDTEPGSFHGPQRASRVHHHGFDRATLKHQLSAAGFSQPRDTTVTTFTKTVAGGHEEEFSVFLIWAERDTGDPSVNDLLVSSLMDRARERTVQQAVVGLRFCGIMLDDGATGVANLCPEVCGKPTRMVPDCLPQPGSSAAELLSTLAPPTRSAVALATANALANRREHWDDPRTTRATTGDLLQVLELRPTDHVGMVGCFAPLVEPIRRRVRQLSIFERGPRLTGDLLPESQAGELLPQCSVAIITATTLLNGTLDALLAAAANCREVVLLGPSTPLATEVFIAAPRHVSLLSGVVVTDAAELLRVVAGGGGTRDFLASVVKVNVRVPGAGTGSQHGESR